MSEINNSPYDENELEKKFYCLAHNHKSRMHEALCSAQYQLENRDNVIATLTETINLLKEYHDSEVDRLFAELDEARGKIEEVEKWMYSCILGLLSKEAFKELDQLLKGGGDE